MHHLLDSSRSSAGGGRAVWHLARWWRPSLAACFNPSTHAAAFSLLLLCFPLQFDNLSFSSLLLCDLFFHPVWINPRPSLESSILSYAPRFDCVAHSGLIAALSPLLLLRRRPQRFSPFLVWQFCHRSCPTDLQLSFNFTPVRLRSSCFLFKPLFVPSLSFRFFSFFFWDNDSLHHAPQMLLFRLLRCLRMLPPLL